MRSSIRRLWPSILLLCAVALILVVHLFAHQVHEESQQESYPSTNYTWIEDGLCLGGMLSEPPPGTKAVLNVCKTKDVYQVEVNRWEPIPDLGPAPGLVWLRSQVEFMDRQRKARWPVYVHCRAGVNRSVMVVAAYLMWREGCTREDALAKIRSKRPSAGPFKVYEEYLALWQKTLSDDALHP